jgi:hypothetical protein
MWRELDTRNVEADAGDGTRTNKNGEVWTEEKGARHWL